MKLVRWFKRLWRFNHSDIVSVRCSSCYDMIDAYSHHDCLFSN